MAAIPATVGIFSDSTTVLGGEGELRFVGNIVLDEAAGWDEEAADETQRRTLEYFAPKDERKLEGWFGGGIAARDC